MGQVHEATSTAPHTYLIFPLFGPGVQGLHIQAVLVPDPWGLQGEWKGPRVLRGGSPPTVQSHLVTAFDSE